MTMTITMTVMTMTSEIVWTEIQCPCASQVFVRHKSYNKLYTSWYVTQYMILTDRMLGIKASGGHDNLQCDVGVYNVGVHVHVYAPVYGVSMVLMWAVWCIRYTAGGGGVAL